MRYLITLVCATFLSLSAYSIEVEVWLYSDTDWNSGMLKIDEGRYTILGDNQVIAVVDASISSDLIYFSQNKSKLKVNYQGKSLGNFDRVFFKKMSDHGTLRTRVNEDERIYPDELAVQMFDDRPFMVNKVGLEKYVSGVVESESGHITDLEYLKAHAIIARTYVVKQMSRFTGNPYDLCDSPQCQAYRSVAFGKNGYAIYKAVFSTQGMILTDKKGNPITAAFHANSGGFTANSEDVWSSELSYLRARKDTFSLRGPSATWEKEIDKNTWINYIASQAPKLKTDTSLQELVCNFTNPDRNPKINVGGEMIEFKDLRREFKLRSAYFDVFEKGNQVVLKGRGYGHGVGLSQDGARYMAQLGYNFRDILSFYYKGVDLESLD